ncbi:MAG: HD domain-containing protein [Lachnospiraceae bacterium]|nr:HD domain-containing protein [Lachnospiraceae bacterium]
MKQNRGNRRKIHKTILEHGSDILRSPGFINSGKSVQHGNMSVRQHSIDVAQCSLKISRKLPFHFEEKDLVRGALLHDYFLYDWHNKKVKLKDIREFHKLHGFTHPITALKNAKKEFELTKRQEDIIRKHMWPLTIKPPACREAWVVTLADKYCSLLETFRLHRGDMT